MTTTVALNRWKPIAEKIADVPRRHLSIPALVSGARGVAEFVQRYWEPSDEHPGLKSAGPRLPRDIADELRSLSNAIVQVEQAYQQTFAATEELQPLMSRGVELLEELTAVLEWQLADVELDKLDVDPDAVEHALASPEDPAELADALSDYAALVQLFHTELSSVIGYDPHSAHEAHAVSRQLHHLAKEPAELLAERRAIVALRERLAHLLQSRLLLVRQAARFAFRKQPALVRRILDDEHRRLQAARRRAQLVVERRQRNQHQFRAVRQPVTAL